MSLVYLTHRVWYCTESTQQAATIWSLEDRLYPSCFTPVWIRWGLDSSSIGVKVKLSVTVIYLQYWGVPIHGLSVLNADCLRQRELHNSVNSSPLVPSDPGWWVSEIVHWSMWTHCRDTQRHNDTQPHPMWRVKQHKHNMHVYLYKIYVILWLNVMGILAKVFIH